MLDTHFNTCPHVSHLVPASSHLIQVHQISNFTSNKHTVYISKLLSYHPTLLTKYGTAENPYLEAFNRK